MTASGSSGPAGLSANAVTSLSLDPPLMLACIDLGSRTLGTVEEAGIFAINVLGSEDEGLARQFGRKAPMGEKWDGVGWRELAGAPVLDAAIIAVVCEVREILAGGDHVIVTGEVLALEQREGEALVFLDGRYGSLRAPG